MERLESKVRTWILLKNPGPYDVIDYLMISNLRHTKIYLNLVHSRSKTVFLLVYFHPRKHDIKCQWGNLCLH